jgi:DinB superfamily
MALSANVYQDFLKVCAFWETELDKYSDAQLVATPPSGGWSIGQVYNHLINATLEFHLPQVETCVASNTDASARKNFKGFMVYSIFNGFPKSRIKVADSDAYTPKQPQSKAEILANFTLVKEKMAAALTLLSASNVQNGKTAHPGLSFLNAKEWYQLVEMHWRHHLNQKQRLDLFLFSK